MKFYPEARMVYGEDAPAGYYGAFCRYCDEEITGEDPVFYEPDGDVDDEGRPIDCSLHCCKTCGVEKGFSTT